MKLEMHVGVGVLIGNKNRTRFFIQQKDNFYPHEEWRNCFSFWGGAIEPEDKDAVEAANREIQEEIPDAYIFLKNEPKVFVGQFTVQTPYQPFELHVYEVLVADAVLSEIAKVKVLEGKGVLLTREEALTKKWIWNTDFIFHNHLNPKDK